MRRDYYKSLYLRVSIISFSLNYDITWLNVDLYNFLKHRILQSAKMFLYRVFTDIVYPLHNPK